MILKDLKDIITIRYIQLEFKNEESLSFKFTNGKYLCLEGTVNCEMFEKFGEQKITQIKTYHVECLNIKLDSICLGLNRGQLFKQYVVKEKRVRSNLLLNTNNRNLGDGNDSC